MAKKKKQNIHSMYPLKLVEAAEQALANGEVDKAASYYGPALEKRPKDGRINEGLGMVYLERGEWEKAARHLAISVESRPQRLAAWHHLGMARFQACDYDGAREAFERVVAEKQHPDALRGMALSLSMDERYAEAFPWYLKLFEVEPDDLELRRDLVFMLAREEIWRVIDADDKHLAEALEALFEDQNLDPQVLAPASARLLIARYDFEIPPDPEFWEVLAKDALFINLLMRTVNVDLDLERFLRALRRSLLMDSLLSPDSLDHNTLTLAHAVAVQNYYNEYLIEAEDDEWIRVQQLRMELEGSVVEDLPGSLTLFAMYQSPRTLASLDALAAPERTWPKEIGLMVQHTMLEPALERAFAAEIPMIGKITDQTSLAVRNRYEDNPFPKWVELQGINGAESTGTLRGLYFIGEPNPVDERQRILVAGCGTGKQALQVARDNSEADVLAIDLSRSALAFAQRKAEELEIDNIRFHQADILDLAHAERYDRIEVINVLHHMDDPKAGWRILAEMLKPGGMMRVGLYSEIARQEVKNAQELATAKGFSSEVRDMRRFRRMLVEDPEHHDTLRALQGYDFFNLSVFREQVSHEKEHCYTLLQLKEILDELGLRFKGFELDDEMAGMDYMGLYPDDPDMLDLTHWHEYETKNPELFLNQYMFWVTLA